MLCLAILLVSLDSLADDRFMLEQGQWKDARIGFAEDSNSLSYAHLNGQYQSLTINLGDYDFAKVSGQIRRDATNNYTNWKIGYVLTNDDQLSMSSLTLSDQIQFKNSVTGTATTMDSFYGNVSAVSYQHTITTPHEPDFFGFPKLTITYRVSTMPSFISIANTASGEQQRLLDMSPTSQETQIGLSFQSLQNQLDRKKDGFIFFADSEWKLGYINQMLSHKIYDTSSPLVSNPSLTYQGIPSGPAYIHSLGIQAKSGSDIYWGVDLQLGCAYLFKLGGHEVDFHAGWYETMMNPLSNPTSFVNDLLGPLHSNDLNSGHSWFIENTYITGFFAGTAFSF